MTTSRDVSVPGTDREASALTGTITPGFIETMGMRVLRGRALGREDHEGAPPVAVISESLARRLFDGEGALGKRVRVGETPGREVVVVGIVADARTNELRSESHEALFLPLAQAPDYLRGLQVRTQGDPMLAAAEVRRAIDEAFPNLPILQMTTIQSRMELLLGNERLLARLSTSFGLVALFVVCIGLYGVIDQWAAQRTREIGLRMALGATTERVRWLVLRQAFGLVLGGVAVGIPAALTAARVLKGMLFGVGPTDPATLAIAALVMFTVAALAAYLPARRASRVDPMVALRHE
jgi:predicted permease